MNKALKNKVAGWVWNIKENFKAESGFPNFLSLEKKTVKENELRVVFMVEDKKRNRYYVKHDKPQTLLNKIKARIRSKVRSEYKSAQLLERCGIRCVEYLGWGMKGSEGMLVSRELADSENALSAWFSKASSSDKKKKTLFLGALARFLSQFFNSGINHPDFHLGNLLVKKASFEFFIVDPYGVRKNSRLSKAQVFEMQKIIGALRGELTDEEASELIINSGMALDKKSSSELWARILQSETCEMEKLWDKRKRQILSGNSKYSRECNIAGNKWRIRKAIGGDVMLDEKALEIPESLADFFYIEEHSREDAEKIWLASFKLQFHRLPCLAPAIWRENGKSSKNELYFEKSKEGEIAEKDVEGEFRRRASLAGVDVRDDAVFLKASGMPCLKSIANIAFKICLLFFLFFIFSESLFASSKRIKKEGIFIEPLSSIFFPEKLGPLKRASITEYTPKVLGFSLKYLGGDSLNADIYIYDMGLKNIAKGNGSPQVMKNFKRGIRDIFLAQKKGYYNSVEVIFRKELTIKTAAGPLKFLCAGLEYKAKTIQKKSYLLVSGYENSFIKIRFTFSEKGKGEGEKILKEFLLAFGQLLESPLSKKHTMKAISIFQKDPFGEGVNKALGIIYVFAEKSPDVIVRITPKVVPWISKGLHYKYSSILLGAFIAGNIKSQLERKIKEDSPYSGLMETFKVYKQIKRKDNKISMPEIDKLLKLKADGELKDFLVKDNAPDKVMPPERPVKK